MVHVFSMRTEKLILTKKKKISFVLIVSSQQYKRFYGLDIWGRRRNQQAHSISGEKNNKLKKC